MKNTEKKIQVIEARGITVNQFGQAWTLSRGQRHMQVADLRDVQSCDLDYLAGNNTRASESRYRDVARVA
ncbi:MAG: hypothetical protein ABIR35_06245 [Polaromonas sp.]